MSHDPEYQPRYKPMRGKRLTDFLTRPYRWRPSMTGDPKWGVGLPYLVNGRSDRDRSSCITTLYWQAMREKKGLSPKIRSGLWFWT